MVVITRNTTRAITVTIAISANAIGSISNLVKVENIRIGVPMLKTKLVIDSWSKDWPDRTHK
jgi:hypothetical protein